MIFYFYVVSRFSWRNDKSDDSRSIKLSSLGDTDIVAAKSGHVRTMSLSQVIESGLQARANATMVKGRW